MAKSMSASVVVRPRPKRIDAPARSPVAPIACSTGAGAETVLVPAAVDLTRERQLRLLAPDVQCAGSLRTVVLVTGERQQVHAERGDVQRHFSGSLRRVGVEEDASLLGDRSDRTKR